MTACLTRAVAAPLGLIEGLLASQWAVVTSASAAPWFKEAPRGPLKRQTTFHSQPTPGPSPSPDSRRKSGTPPSPLSLSDFPCLGLLISVRISTTTKDCY